MPPQNILISLRCAPLHQDILHRWLDKRQYSIYTEKGKRATDQPLLPQSHFSAVDCFYRFFFAELIREKADDKLNANCFLHSIYHIANFYLFYNVEDLMISISNMIASYGWTITYDVFNINFNIPFSKQLNELNEDLLQALNGNYIIDIGWYPEMNPQGKIITLLIKNSNWNNPIKTFEDTDYFDFINHINYLLSMIKSDGHIF